MSKVDKGTDMSSLLAGLLDVSAGSQNTNSVGSLVRMIPSSLTPQSQGVQSLDRLVSPPRPSRGPAPLDPGKFGTDAVITTTTNISYKYGKNKNEEVTGRVYKSSAPGPLVLVFPADGSGKDGYIGLAHHLASYGFNVAVILNPAQSEGFDEGTYVQSAIHYLYTNNSPFPNGHLSDDVVLLGHSHGGRVAIQNALYVSTQKIPGFTPKQLRSLVIMAPSFGEMGSFTISEFYQYALWLELAGSFLGIAAAADNDSNAKGLKAPGQPMQSGFLVYDTIGSQPFVTTPNSKLPKDMIYFHDPSVVNSSSVHYFQNNLIARAYITAHLMRHVMNVSDYDIFLKLQVRPGSLQMFNGMIRQQHDELRHTIMDGDHKGENLASVSTSQFGVTVLSGLEPWVWDQFSPHSTKCLAIVWDRLTQMSKNQIGPNHFTLAFKEPVLNIEMYRYLVFRATQVHPASTPNKEVDMDITMSGKLFA